MTYLSYTFSKDLRTAHLFPCLQSISSELPGEVGQAKVYSPDSFDESFDESDSFDSFNERNLNLGLLALGPSI